jgi:glycine dehydrogenase
MISTKISPRTLRQLGIRADILRSVSAMAMETPKREEALTTKPLFSVTPACVRNQDELSVKIGRGFEQRHVGPGPREQRAMLETLGFTTIDELIERTVPESIRLRDNLQIADAMTEAEMREEFERIAKKNEPFTSFIGMGYHNCHTPGPILRDVLMNPGWHTQYSPYQAEISQGRLQSLLNFQTMVSDLTGLPVANSSLLDEATAACESLSLMMNGTKGKRSKVLVDSKCHPQTIACLQTRAGNKNIDVLVINKSEMAEVMDKKTVGVIVQYPDTEGNMDDISELVDCVHDNGGLVSMATDLLALSIIKSPGELNADVAFGSSQRLGIPMYLGGPAAAFFATRTDFARQVPGRIVGVSKDVNGKPALRLSLQAREQHIRREKATSNVCTAQALLANATAMWGVYHGPEGMVEIAESIHHAALVVAHGAQLAGHKVVTENFFDTMKIDVGEEKAIILKKAHQARINLRDYSDESCIGIALGKITSNINFLTNNKDDTVTRDQIDMLLLILGSPKMVGDLDEMDLDDIDKNSIASSQFVRKTSFMEHEVFKMVRDSFFFTF